MTAITDASTTATLSRLEAELRHLVDMTTEDRKESRDFRTQVQSVLMERTGEAERDRKRDSDINGLGGIVRENVKRIEVLEDSASKAKWMVLGAVFGMKALDWIVPVIVSHLPNLGR